MVARLIAGETLKVSGADEFSLPLDESRAILNFYNQDRRAYWNPDKDTAIQDGEVDRVLAALDNVPTAQTTPIKPSAPRQKWQLVKVVAHRFRGLHRHCDDKGADPKVFEVKFTAPATLFRGFNGAGKTSLISAICWCLTESVIDRRLCRHRCTTAFRYIAVSKALEAGPEDGRFDIPVIVPIPTERELILVDGAPKVDTWVRLTFRSLIDEREVEVERQLEARWKKGLQD